MENEIMNYADEVMESEFEVVEAVADKSGMGAGMAMLIVVAATVATGAIVTLGKKAWVKHKAKKELHLVDERDFVEPTEEAIVAVTKK
jgi:hypothetical protein